MWNDEVSHVFQTIAVVTLIDAQIIPSLANGSVFKFIPASFLLDPIVFHSVLCAGMTPHSRFILCFLFQVWNQPFSQEALVSFRRKYYLETINWVLG